MSSSDRKGVFLFYFFIIFFFFAAIESGCPTTPFPLSYLPIYTLSPLLQSHFSRSRSDLLDECFEEDPTNRPTADELLASTVFSGARPMRDVGVAVLEALGIDVPDGLRAGG